MSLPSSVILQAVKNGDVKNLKVTGDITLSGEVEQLTEDKGVLKQIITKGEGKNPVKGSKVAISYKCTLNDSDTIIDSSSDIGGKYEFVLGKGNVIKAWDIGISTMRKGEISVFVCRDDYCYSEEGSPPNVPPNSTLKYTLELLDWEPPFESSSQRISAANNKKEEGNIYFKEGSTEKAEKTYQKALEYLSEENWNISQQEEAQINSVKVLLYLNLAACYLKTKNYNSSLENCTKVCKMEENSNLKALDLEPKNIKALYRRGQTYSLNGDLDRAKEDLEAAIKLAPNSTDIKKELEQLRKTIQANNLKEKKMFGNLFEKLKKEQNHS